MKWFFISLSILLFNNCTKTKTHLEYFSVSKSNLNDTYGRIEDGFNFYKFQKYYQSARLDSAYLSNYKCNFKDSVIYRFLKAKYTKNGYEFSNELLSHIGRFNAENFNDTTIIVIDINDSISLINLSPEFAIYSMGTCCSPYQNLIVRRRGNLIVFQEVKDELIGGKLLGVYLKQNGNIDGILIQGYSNDYGNFKGLNSNFNLKYKITKKGIIPEEILNVRNGEPFDKNDTIEKEIKDFGVQSVYF
jgi:hypothetical protein